MFKKDAEIQLQVLLRARISYGNSVRPSVSLCHDPVRMQCQVR